MLTKKITYTDYFGEERTETFYFNLTKAELVDMNYSISGGYSEMLQRIVDEKNTVQIAKIFKELILKAYGERSDDGRHFYKIDENGHSLANKFAQTEAFSVLYMELLSDEKVGAQFFRDILPSDIRDAAIQQQTKQIANQ